MANSKYKMKLKFYKKLKKSLKKIIQMLLIMLFNRNLKNLQNFFKKKA